MKELLNFNLNAPFGTHSHTVVFKQPLKIHANTNVVVNSVVIEWVPLTGYKQDSFCIITDLPIKTFHSKGFEGQRGGAAENRVMVFVPPNQDNDSSVDDPAAGIPLIAQRSYEPVQPVVHTMLNNELSLNAINFQVVDAINLQPRTDVNYFSVNFTLSHDC